MSKKEYWDRFYAKNNKNTFEWLVDTSCINEISYNLKKDKKFVTLMLDAGCGSSMFGSKLANSISNDSTFLICTDFSREALEIIKRSHDNQSYQLIDYIECDCKYLPIRKNLFDLVLDKGFTDSVLKTNGLTCDSVKGALDSIKNLIQILEISESNDEPNFLIQITDEIPELRISLFDQNKFDIKYYFKEINIDKNFAYFAYFIYKNE